jgi:MFS family permease
VTRQTAFYLQASIILFFLAGSSAPTPLYAVYQAAWGFSPITVTVVFGVYAIAVLSALLVAGSLSDHLGRRPVLLAATALQVVAMALFVVAQGVGGLVAARVVQGLSTGAAAGAVGAGMVDIHRAKGTVANSIAPQLGTATGAILSGLMVTFLPMPTRLVYVVLGLVFAAQFAGVALMAESVTPRPGALASLRPRFRLPMQARGPLAVAAPALIASWALVGFYGSLGPAVARRLTGSHSAAVGGVVLFVLAATGAASVFLLRARSAHVMLVIGTSALTAGVAATTLAIAHASVPLFFTGLVIAGTGFGAAFQGALRAVLPLARPHERAGVLSILYVIAYLAMGVPAILGGVRVVYGGGLLSTAREYGLVVMALAVTALVGTLLRALAEGRQIAAAVPSER